MSKERAWPVRLMYILIAAALAMSLIVMAAPAQKATAADADVAAEWEKVGTPTTEGWVLAPNSTIIDYALDADGEVAYAAVMAYGEDPCDDDTYGPHLLKSDDYGATWSDLTDALEDLIDVDGGDYIEYISRVATDWVDPDFLAVSLLWYDYSLDSTFLNVFFSTDGGTAFVDAGEVEDSPAYLYMVADLVVSPEAGGVRDIFIGGTATGTTNGAGLFHCAVTGSSAGGWQDVTDPDDYEGWDNMWPSDVPEDDIYSWVVTDIVISPSWAIDKTVLVTTVAHSEDTGYQGVYMQCGSWTTSPGWNAKSTLGIDAVELKTDDANDVEVPDELVSFDARGIAGMTLPSDYNSKSTDTRLLWAWVNYYGPGPSYTPICEIARVEDDSADPVGPMGQVEDGEVWLTNVSYKGTIAEGEAIAGVLGDGGYAINTTPTDLFTPCCEGVQVYRNNGIVNMDICCERWHKACKPPTGNSPMAVSYVGDDKAYAVALMGVDSYEEGAWSVTFDDGDTWNQLSLIDTEIDYLSDVAKSPDCNKTFLATVNYDYGCYCDSVWLHAETLPEAEEYSGQWLRTWSGILEGDNEDDFPYYYERSLLRLAPEETTGDTVFLVDRMSGNVYWNDLETLACWHPIASTVITHIVDLVAQDADTLFALDESGDVAMFDEDEWQAAVDSEVEEGWSIVVSGDHILVGGQDGDASYSDDAGETFSALADVYTDEDVYVNLAFDSYFNQNDTQNDTVYAALAHAYDHNGIYLLVIGGEVESWTKLAASSEYDYTGIVLDRPNPGNPKTSAATGGVLYASYQTWDSDDNCDYCCGNDDFEGADEPCWHSGVARCLSPIVELCCGVGEAEWDYLTWGLDDGVYFGMQPQALKICGCLTADTNSRLFAIDWNEYDICDGDDGTVWTFEDCYAKKGVELDSPDDEFVVGPDACDCCNVPFSISWDRLCDACCYEIQFAMDEEFTDLFLPHIGEAGEGSCYDPSWFCPDTPMEPSVWVGCWFDPGFTYYWRVRAVEAETCQDITSWWSEPRSFTVAPTAETAAIDLVAPEPGTTSVPLTDVGFSWDMLATWDEFDFVLWKDGAAVDSQTGLASTYYQTDATLTYDTTYSWQVIAYNDGVPISTSSVGTFRTMTEAEGPVEPEEAKTPFWVWIVIAIGAVLVIVVIVLIFRTRRV